MDSCLSLTETKLSREGSSFPAEMPLIKSIGVANSAVTSDSSKISAFMPQEHQITMHSDKCKYIYLIYTKTVDSVFRAL